MHNSPVLGTVLKRNKNNRICICGFILQRLWRLVVEAAQSKIC